MARRLGPAKPRGNTRNGAGACEIPSHDRHVNFSRTYCSTFHCRGTTSSVSLTSSPSLVSRVDPQHVHAVGPGTDRVRPLKTGMALAARHVDLDGTVEDHAILAAPTSEMRRIGTGDQRLRWRAAGIDAGAAKELPLNERHRHACSGKPIRERRSGLPGSDDNGLEAARHFSSPQAQKKYILKALRLHLAGDTRRFGQYPRSRRDRIAHTLPPQSCNREGSSAPAPERPQPQPQPLKQRTRLPLSRNS